MPLPHSHNTPSFRFAGNENSQRGLPIRPCGSLQQPISLPPYKQKICFPHGSQLPKTRREKKNVTLFIRTLNKENFRIDFTGSFETDRNPPEAKGSTQETRMDGGRGGIGRGTFCFNSCSFHATSVCSCGCIEGSGGG